jgi:organic radical activating enzyme
MSKIDPNKLLISSDFYSVQGDDIKNGNIHIIWTGGEPTIKGHQDAICNFFTYWLSQDKDLSNVYNEIETNGTVEIGTNLFSWINQINSSPKLENSGMTAKQRIVPAAIKRIMEHSNYQFKFVISTEDDVKELFRDFVEPFNIPLKNVVCMPGLDDQDDFHERTNFVLEMAKIYKFRGLTRLHISAWNKTLNV